MFNSHLEGVLRNDLTDMARIAFMFNGGQSPGSTDFSQAIDILKYWVTYAYLMGNYV